MKKAAELAKVKDYYTETYPGVGSWMDMFMPKDNNGSYLDEELRAMLGELYEPVMEMRRNQQRNRLQARLPYNMKVK